MKYYFTSESVCCGHPDKLCDKIADKILDCALEQDKDSKMAVEATIKDNFVLIYGEANTKAKINYKKIVNDVLHDIGYTEDFDVLVKVNEQSIEINQAVVKDKICAGDQGIMFGYATNETEEYMPLAIQLANKLAYNLSNIRKDYSFLKPDGKTQVTVCYVNDKPKYVDTVIIAQSHDLTVTEEYLKEFIIENVIKKTIPSYLLTSDTKYLVNTSGAFTIYGPFSDSGTTGRKLICDTYGGYAHIGGGCLSSKDPSKVDRSACYYARYVAKNIVHYGLCDKCEIQLSYAIGKDSPISLFIDTFNTNKVPIEDIYKFLDNFDFSVSNIIEELDLLRPIYYKTAAFGHFGRTDILFPWEKIKKIK